MIALMYDYNVLFKCTSTKILCYGVTDRQVSKESAHMLSWMDYVLDRAPGELNYGYGETVCDGTDE